MCGSDVSPKAAQLVVSRPPGVRTVLGIVPGVLRLSHDSHSTCNKSPLLHTSSRRQVIDLLVVIARICVPLGLKIRLPKGHPGSNPSPGHRLRSWGGAELRADERDRLRRRRGRLVPCGFRRGAAAARACAKSRTDPNPSGFGVGWVGRELVWTAKIVFGCGQCHSFFVVPLGRSAVSMRAVSVP